ncbi:TRAP transporter small permease [Polaribacter batillariae]|uniref:TRAP transporter small permease n=1 Tax=Polaribacter batillariae TaxID=2808900 RepID=A0ABX7SW37_9FLAO|nr:TRAP transporter small permease [Polaribacter batillariae]QTD38467.1 TRAP transporter small permease [Polaribacter batillariae]
MEKAYLVINKFLKIALVFIFSILVIDVLWQVFARYSIGKPNAFTEELARYLLIWLAILGTAYVRGYKGQMAIDYLYNKLRFKNQQNLSLFIELAIILFALVVMVVGGINLMYITLKLGQISPALNLPIGYVYSVVPLSGLLIIFYSIYHCFHLIKNRKENLGTNNDLLKTNL